MAAQYPSLAVDSSSSTSIATRDTRILPSQPASGDSFESALAEARKPAQSDTKTDSTTDDKATVSKKAKPAKKAEKKTSTSRTKKHDATAKADHRRSKTTASTDADDEEDGELPDKGKHQSNQDADEGDKDGSNADANAGKAKAATPELPLDQQQAAANQAQALAAQTAAAAARSRQSAGQTHDKQDASAPVVAKTAKADDSGDGDDDIDGTDATADGDAADAVATPAGNPGKSGHGARAVRGQANVEQSAGDENTDDSSGDIAGSTSSFSNLLAGFEPVSASDDQPAPDLKIPTTATATAEPQPPVGVADGIAPSPTNSNDSSTVRAANAPATPQAAFATANHPTIVQSVHTQLLPDGGTMHIRLDPPELGVLQVSVHMKDGVMSASFQTSNDDATKLLSHSMGQLKQALEAQGVTVGKMHVQQTPRDQGANAKQKNGEDGESKQQQSQDSSAKQEQQRREALQRMWQRLSLGSDPLDLVA